jgi:ATP-dependent helicase/nuclease subunit A
MSLTSTQQQAIAARGNVLVVAGAGTGKTRTLVERCLNCLLEEQPPASLEEILMVTFTDAAAAEMRQRIRARLEQERKRQPDNPRWDEQLALFETAHIGTLHGFCLQLVRQHFYELELDPQLAVLAEEEARLLAGETLDDLLQRHYAGRSPAAEAVQQLIQAQGRGGDKPIRRLVLRLHHYTQTLPHPAGWFRDQLAMFASPEPTVWRQWLAEGVADWRRRWLPLLNEHASRNDVAAECAKALESIAGADLAAASREKTAAILETVCAAPQNCPRGKKTEWIKPLKDFLDEADFLLSLVKDEPQDPLVEDWNWARGQMTALLQLAREFTEAFTEAKRELGVVDFHDLEQHALRLLWDSETNQPTKTAQQWRKKLRFVFVDEYQDINAAQDKIIEALSREGAGANRFLVGDIKQSIYRFRLADPHIFQQYIEAWRGEAGRAIPLVENFRSREGVLAVINSLFGVVMQRELGGVRYDEQTMLRFGAPEERRALSTAADSTPCVELHLRVKGGRDDAEDDEASEGLAEVAELEEADKEARLVALRLRELKARREPVWDEQAKGFRPVAWSDMAILLRAPSGKAESYAKEFARLHVPLLVARGGFYESLEISDLLSLLNMLDNPLQDLPVLAVLHSPLVGLTLDELATIRLTAPKSHFWTALLKWHEEQIVAHNPKSDLQKAESGSQKTEEIGSDSRFTFHVSRFTPAIRKVGMFLERFGRWRRLARLVSLSRCIEAVLSETHYAAWLLTQARGEQRHANVQRLVGLAQQFDQFQRQGLYRFLRFVEAQQDAETEPDVAAVSQEDSVRLMSIHQSKGLEFPVVVVADLGKPFNLSDLRADMILDEQYGLCPQIKPPQTGKSYPSLPYWLARQRQQRELLGEELRLLYVAMTRARDHLILSGGISETKFNRLWAASGEVNTAALLSARSYSDWVGLWFARQAGLRREASSPQSSTAAEMKGGLLTQGESAGLRWVIHDDSELADPGAAEPQPEALGESLLTAEPAVWEKLRQRLEWQYPRAGATRQPAKTSVSALRRRAAAADDEAVRIAEFRDARQRNETADAKAHESEAASRITHHASRFTSAEIGTAHHEFLQLVSLDRVGSTEELEQEARRLRQAGAMTAEEVEHLDFKALAAFWESEVGRKVRAQAQFVQRELPFTIRFSPEELAALTGERPTPDLAEEFVVVQGVADLVVLLPEEIWLLDFKTDRVRPAELADKAEGYGPQLKLYARALSRIYRRPVSNCWLYFLAAQAAVRIEPG